MVMSKAGSEVILKCLMGKERDIDVEALPWGPEDESVPAGIETVIPASEIRPARGKTVDEVVIRRDGGVAQRVVVSSQFEDVGEDLARIKEEPKD